MPDVTIVKLKIRRGTESQRRTITLEQGELGYVTDTRRVFVGDGITVGGVPVSNVNHPPISDPALLTSQRNAVINDFIYAGTYLYQLTATNYETLSSWARVSNNLIADGQSLDYANVGGRDYLKIKDRGITGSMFSDSVTSYLGGLSATPTGLKANVDNQTLTVTNSNLLSVYSIDHRHISNSSFSSGLTGGSGKQISLNVDERFFNFTEEENKLTLNNIPDESVSFFKLDSNILGPGLMTAGEQIISQYVRGIGPGLENDAYGNLLLSDTTSPNNSYFKNLDYNSKGQITGYNYSINTTLSCDSSSPGLAIFNGSPGQIILGAPYTNQTIVTCLSTDPMSMETEQVVLSSAGFICFNPTFSKDGLPVGRFAIPVFTY